MAESDLIRGNVDTIILKVLYEGDRYGYDLIKQINARSEGQWEIKQPTVYACLKRLEKQGFISSYWDSSESDGGRRKYYSLTESGKEVFLKYKTEFERASALFGGIISGSTEPTVFIQPEDDYSDVEDEGYTLPKRKVKRTPKKADKPIEKDEQATPDLDEAKPEAAIEPQQPTAQEHTENAPPENLFELEKQAEEQSEASSDEPAREALDPKLIIEQIFAAENGESYSDIQRKNTFSTQTDEAPAAQPAEQKQPVQKAEQKPQQKAVQPVADNRTLPTPTPDRPMLVPAAIPGFDSSPAPVGQKQPSPTDNFATEEESPARREYKTVLEELVDRFEVSAPVIRPAKAAEREQAATAEAAEASQLGKVEKAVRELGNDVKVRNHNNSAKEYNGKNYYYSNRLMMTHYTIMCATMFIIGLVMFLTFYVGLNMRMKYDYVLYICAGLLPILMFVAAIICYANNPDKTRRININAKFSIIIRFVIMIQVAVVIYCVNLIFGMPLAFSEYYIPSIALPLAYSLFIPISEIIFIYLLKSGYYSENMQ